MKTEGSVYLKDKESIYDVVKKELIKANIKTLYKFLLTTGFQEEDVVKILAEQGGDTVINIDLDNINEEMIYEAFNVDGNEAEALNDSYLELFELIGRDAMLKLFKYFRGDKIDCPMRLYRPEFIADLAKQETDRRKRAKIARAGGYTVKFIEGVLSKRRKENEAE